jgi:hypothetical protein
MSESQMPCLASAMEIKKYRRKCFSPHCKRRAFLRDWSGWEWCFNHWWREIKNKENNVWFYLKTTKIF